MSNDFKPSADGIKNYIDFNTTTEVPYRAGRLGYDSDNDTLKLYNSEPDVSLQIGEEMWKRVYNNTGSTILNGSVVYISGYDATNNVPTIALSNATDATKALATIAIATHDIENGTVGRCTTSGTVRDVDTSGCSSGNILYLSTTDGQFTNIAPETPNYLVIIGNCGKVDATTGRIEVSINPFNNKQNATDIFNGAVQEPTDVTVSSNGSTITLSLQKKGGGDLSLYFNNTPQVFDCIPPATVTLTAGTDVSPVENYVYILQSTGLLTSSTSGFPASQHVRIARVICQSASSAQIDGVYKFHSYTEELSDEINEGHLVHINSWIRNQFATWLSGVTPTVTKTTNAGAIDNIDFSSTSGSILQLHEHTFPVFNTGVSSHVHVINDFTTKYDKITDLGSIDTTSTGTTLRNNNDSYSLVVWGAVSETNADSQLYINTPSGKYNTSTDSIVINDASGYTNYSIPTAYKGVGFLIARINIRYTTIDSGTFTIISTEDLRGKIPNTTAGGGGGGSTGGGITPVWAGRDLIPFTNTSNDNLIFDSTFSFNRSTANKEITLNVTEYTPIADASAPTAVEGYVYYNSDYDTCIVYPDITPDSNFRGISIGKMQFMHVYNDTGVDIARGKVVAWNSAFSSTRPTVVLADADTHEAEDVAGFVIKTIANGASGIICTNGWLVNTDLDYISPSPTAGDTLYLSTTAGNADTSLPSSPAKQVVLGKWLASSGTEHNIFVKIMPKTGSGTSTTEFSDAEFRIQDNADATKQASLECSGIPTTTTNTYTFPSVSGTFTLNTATQTLTDKTLTSPVLNTSVSGTAVLDEDNMASNSDTQIATQQSIKAYVDSNKLSGYSVDHANTSLVYGSATTVSFTADVLVVGQYRFTSVNETVAMSTDLDTGTEASSTWYSVIMIYNPSTADLKGLLSTTKTSSNLPSGYTEQRHIGWIYNDASSNFDSEKAFSCFSNFVPLSERTFYSITSTGTQNFSIADAVPPSAYSVAVVLILHSTSTASNITLYSVGGDSTSAYTAQVNQYVGSIPISDGAICGVNSSGNITYTYNESGTNSGTRIEIGGFFQECD